MDLKFTKSTDTEHKIKLESALISASWLSSKAIAGRSATFEVLTAFVGEGAPIKITGKSENGKKLGKIKDVIKRNKYVGAFEIPEDMELDDEIYFEVELPKNDIEGESNRIPVFPPVQVFNLKWSAKEARRGDILTLSADVNGLRDHEEVTVIIYEYDRDGAHDKIIELPATVNNKRIELQWEFEYHEDTDEIPTQEELDKYGKKYNPPEYFFTIKVEDTEFGKQEQESGLLEFKDWIEIELRERDGTPIANARYVVRFADGTEREGSLDENARARLEDIPPGSYRVDFPDNPGFERVESA
ncbi:MAG: hypothetical protein ACE5K8_05435 [Candidatus Zixiibacteriota bacterium]